MNYEEAIALEDRREDALREEFEAKMEGSISEEDYDRIAEIEDELEELVALMDAADEFNITEDMDLVEEYIDELEFELAHLQGMIW